MSLLIFGYTYRLLWEGVLFRQNLVVNRINSISFMVKDMQMIFLHHYLSTFLFYFHNMYVANVPKCLSEGYPCLANR